MKLKGITFPDFGKDHSKENFRLMVNLNYFDGNHQQNTANVIFPADKFWQWRDKTKRFYIPPKPVTGNTVELDLGVFTNNESEFSETDLEVLVFQGKLYSIAVHVIDVEDDSFADVFIKGVKLALPIVIDELAGGLPTLIDNAFAKKLVGKIAGEFKGTASRPLCSLKPAGGTKCFSTEGDPNFRQGRLRLKAKGSLQVKMI